MSYLPSPPEKHFWQVSYNPNWQVLKIQLRRKYPLIFSDPVEVTDVERTKSRDDRSTYVWRWGNTEFDTLEAAVIFMCELLLNDHAAKVIPEEVSAILGSHHHVKG
ncbi:hypothetical protein PXH69_24595 [Rhodococcus qingshengii]|uniref:Uncharacterized protein n=1 Tax=Rhodococcus qingshengii TaxID=334542 RepID=A0AAW6LRR0_RHOSG|nr:hypothetical protein [Rhodococcus qingshengii]MDE8648151.1 hypothetical protein [Rhodococcus qingshengii]